jgi:hypothetical protein
MKRFLISSDWLNYNSFLELLKIHLGTFIKYRDLQKKVTDNINDIKSGEIARLEIEERDLNSSLSHEKQLLSPLLNEWKCLSADSRKFMISGELGVVLDQIEKAAMSISQYQSSVMGRNLKDVSIKQNGDKHSTLEDIINLYR